MESGFRAAQAFVEVTARLDDDKVLAAARRAAAGMETTLRDGGERAGRTLTTALERAGNDAGVAMVGATDKRLRDSHGKFAAAGTGIGDQVGKATATTFGASLTKNMPVALGPAAGVALAFLAPTISAGLGAAVIGGAAGLGIVGGVILAARDERVKAAGTALGAFVLGDLEARSTAFVPVVIDGIAEIRHAWVGMGPDIDRIFKSSRLVEPLVDGFTKGARHLVGGIADAVDKADPVVDAFGRLLDGVGDAAGQVFTTLAEDADEGASAVDDLTLAMTNLITATGGIIHAGAKVKGFVDEADTWIDKGRIWVEDSSYLSGALERVGITLDLTADGFKAGSKEAEAYRAAVTGTAGVTEFATLKAAGYTDAQIAGADASGTYRQKIGEVNNELGITQSKAAEVSARTRIMNQSMADSITAAGGLSAAFQILNGGVLNARQAESDYQAAIDAVTASVKKHGAGLNKQKTDFDLNTEAGRANDKQIRTLVGTIDQKAQATYDETLATKGQAAAETAAKGVYESGRQQLIKNLTQILGNAGAATALADKIMGIPKSWGTEVKLTDLATAKAKAIRAAIQNIHGRTVIIEVKYETSGRAPGEHTIGQGTQLKDRWGGVHEGGYTKAATGLVRDAAMFGPRSPGTYLIAEPETGGELFAPKNGDMGRIKAMVSYAIENWWGGWGNFLPQGASGPSGPGPMPAGRQAARGGDTTVTFGPGSIVLDASKIKSLQDLLDMVANLGLTARTYRMG